MCRPALLDSCGLTSPPLELTAISHSPAMITYLESENYIAVLEIRTPIARTKKVTATFVLNHLFIKTLTVIYCHYKRPRSLLPAVLPFPSTLGVEC